MTADTRPVLITGGAGFIGANLADRLAGDGHAVLVYDALSRPGVERNLAWLRARHGDRIRDVTADIRDADRLTLNPDCGFAPGKDHEVPLDESYEKLKSLAAAAQLLRDRQAS